MRHSDIVYNLVGRDYPTKYAQISLWLFENNNAKLFRNFTLEDVHVEGAERIAEAVAKYDVDRFVHVSSYNANKNSSSEFFRTKVRRPNIQKLLPVNTCLLGSRRRSRPINFSRNNNSSPRATLRLRGPPTPQASRRNKFVHLQLDAGALLACPCTSNAACMVNARSNLLP